MLKKESSFKVLFFLPIPPPFAGPEVSAFNILNSSAIKKLDFVHLNANIRKENHRKGILDFEGVFSFLKLFFRFIGKLRGTSVVYMFLSSSKFGFLKDSFFILSAKLFGKQVVAQYKGSFFDTFFFRQNFVYKYFIKFTLAKLSSLVLLGPSLTDSFKDIYSGKLNFLPNGVVLNHFLSNSSFPPPVNFVFLGHLSYPKGFFHLICAYKMLFEKYSSQVRLVFAGGVVPSSKDLSGFVPDKYKDYYVSKRNFISNSISDFISCANDFNAEYLGVLEFDEKFKVLASCDVLVQPSFTEGLSNSVLESFASSLAVIHTDVGCLKDYVSDKNVLFCSVDDVDSLFEKMEFLVLNRPILNSMKSANLDLASSKFDVEVVAGDLVKILFEFQ